MQTRRSEKKLTAIPPPKRAPRSPRTANSKSQHPRAASTRNQKDQHRAKHRAQHPPNPEKQRVQAPPTKKGAPTQRSHAPHTPTSPSPRTPMYTRTAPLYTPHAPAYCWGPLAARIRASSSSRASSMARLRRAFLAAHAPSLSCSCMKKSLQATRSSRCTRLSSGSGTTRTRHAAMERAPPMYPLSPKDSPRKAAPMPAAHRGSVENMSAVSELESLPTMTVSAARVKADDMSPIHSSARSGTTLPARSKLARAVRASPLGDARFHSALVTAQMSTWIDVMPMASLGNLCMAASVRKR
mmetsp:Transcript_14061/g.34365  ORF Transcript_14061/g.34365 Transcript_14061/m.34365 type:complete len:298 (-) Transcript_14061:930-1823(-)